MQPPINFPVPYQPHRAFTAAFEHCPLIAILRGITPNEAADHCWELYEAGFRVIEVPLNSPKPFDSISEIRKAVPADAIVGAGTVLHASYVKNVKAAGGELIVMPHSDPEIIFAAKAQGLASASGVSTPTEAFQALKNGADALKVFPAEVLGPRVVKAWRAVIAPEVPLVPVGGITPESMEAFLASGANGFGLGAPLYMPGQSAAVTASRAQAFITSLHAAKAKLL
ncbi:2-dehydro-3-deoxy-6-phosphogalactonate aldolase [Burkholderia diffusa]|uniref:2-dehydro-3-deoxy-6-phosphogalactonate aldolase n=1 Tax=Burkholderia diffusa TaxID=488732 RepID=UPI0007592229|nr:2-dehydro-3-deoxy-6-phosphogalactonate aldolase [Burkholderia diffusa]KWF86757.1 2-dehydro-3-deoxy-6-phosphogalactonate aldolase [Burkholderia diffusa]